jgi:3-oxoacyl-[acyl-carrier protein] reductase
MSKRLAGKVALVTGGSRGIGAAIVKRLASEGADVALTYVSKPDQADETVKAAEALGVKALAIQADSTDAQAVVGSVERTVKELGGLDILVNNAGIFVGGRIDDVRLEDLDRTLAVNVRAVFVATQAAVKHMQEGGRIINIGSCNVGPRGITVNNVDPGPVDTDMNPSTSAFAKTLLDKVMAIPRYASADEIASLVAYLASPEAAFVMGASLNIDGGFTA